MQNALNASSTASLKHFIPQSPATNIKRKEISRWQQRQNKNANQMTLLSNIETYFEKQESEKVNLSNNNTINNNTKKKTSFLRRGQGTINQRNKYKMEQQKQAERKRMKQLGVIQTKPKTQKIIFMEQWREKQKKKAKIAISRKKTVTNTYKIPNNTIKNTVKIEHNEQKAPSIHNDELESASKFEDVSHFEPINPQQIEEKNEEQNINTNTEIGIWSKPKLPQKISISHPAKSKTYNFGRNSVLSNDRKQRKHHPSYSHHHHSISLYGNKKGIIAPSAKQIKTKYVTVNTISKRDRLAAKSIDRKINKTGISVEKEYISKTNELKEIISKYQEKIHDAEIMKQSSLESFRKYQALINEKSNGLEIKQKEFEKYKKKQEKILCQKSAEIEKRNRQLLNIPDRKQRTQIQQLKKEINDLKLEFIEKEKRYKSKIERLKKQNKKINNEKLELKNEMKKFEQERLEFWKHKNKNKIVENKNNNNMRKKKKKYSISKVNVETQRPKSQQMMKKTISNIAYVPQHGIPNTIINRSTNNMYQRFQNMNNNQFENIHSQSMNNVQLLAHYNNNINEEYDSTSSESSSSSDNSIRNGEDTERKDKEEVEVEVIKNSNHLPVIPPEFAPDKMSTEQINSESVKNNDNPIERMQHPDGKIEQIYSDGSKLILFPNQTEKYIFSNLKQNNGIYKQIYVKFPNGDVKKVLSDGTEVYYYSNNNIIHASKIDGTQLFYFSSQHEIHFADNTKHILFADGTKKYIYPNGDEQCVYEGDNNSK